ncbi:response regulator transcription factor [Fulvivirgaceae bacterium BMA10]|uniref:Response regulator transcription factor n=1 Tax=Splendidivirga corallicola TaxID=3051826 RepID=A0ABT8KTK4_9BACT|nr:response regulator transcription factor [Fulvivirgaceae bacterium BMA10]
MNKNGKKILLVEDDLNLGYVIKDNLEVQGFDVILCEDGVQGFEAFKKGKFNLCILDVMLPKKDGFSLAESIRFQDEQIPIIFLTAKSMKEDKIAGFKVGGDDYITKPFSIEELILRIEVFLKRTSYAASDADQLHCTNIGEYVFDHKNLLLTYKEIPKKLTQKEADILKLFCLRRGEVIKREEILNKIWGDDDYFLGRSLDVFISKLRKYLRNDKRLAIRNFHGVGFKLEIIDAGNVTF